MRTVRTKIYKFKELSEKAKKTAIEHFRDINVTHDWHDWIVEQFKEDVLKRGFCAEKIYFSHFYCQGGGAMFEGEVIDFLSFTDNVDERIIELIQNNSIHLECTIKHRGPYHHENSRYVHFVRDFSNNNDLVNINIEIDKIEKNIECFYVQICRNLYKLLLNEYEWLTSDESVIETIEANQYEFYPNGEFYKG